MAENLPFSIANILRSDFPHPSRISKLPPALQVTPLRESGQSLFFSKSFMPVQRFHHCCSETRLSSLSHVYSVRANGKDFSQNPGAVHEQMQNRLNGEKKEGNF